MCQDDRCEQVTLHLVSTDRCWWMQLVCAPRRSTRPLRLLQRKRSCLSGSGGPRVVSDDARRFYVTPCVSRRWSVFCILESEARRRGLERTYNVVRCLVSVCRVSGIWVRADVYGRCGVHTMSECLGIESSHLCIRYVANAMFCFWDPCIWQAPCPQAARRGWCVVLVDSGSGSGEWCGSRRNTVIFFWAHPHERGVHSVDSTSDSSSRTRQTQTVRDGRESDPSRSAVRCRYVYSSYRRLQAVSRPAWVAHPLWSGRCPFAQPVHPPRPYRPSGAFAEPQRILLQRERRWLASGAHSR